MEMTEDKFQGLELWPESKQAKQLFILLHGLGAQANDLIPLAEQLKEEFPQAGFFLPDATFPFEGSGSGRQWYSNSGVNEGNRAARVASAMPALLAMVSHAQKKFNVLQSDTALVGFSQGAIMALHFAVMHDGQVGRVLAFSGRFAELPEKAPELVTLHLLHGEEDSVIPVTHAHAAYERLQKIEGDVTLDVAAGVGHELHKALSERAIHRLKTSIPLRSWKQAMKSA
jgi:phospholipase/carboxylesterase